MIEGYAVTDRRGQIFIRTVSDTQRAAMVNWLVAEAGIRVMAWATDDDIKEKFCKHHALGLAGVVKVKVDIDGLGV